MPQTEGTDLRWLIIHLVILSSSVMRILMTGFLFLSGAEKVAQWVLVELMSQFPHFQ